MAVIGLDHLVVNTRDIEGSVSFYKNMLGMEILRLDEYREGKVGFVSARVPQEIIIDIRPTKTEDAATPNMDGDVHPAWAAQSMGQQFKIWNPEGIRIELRSYDEPQ